MEEKKSKPEVAPQTTGAQVGFIPLLKASLQFLAKHWWQYIKLAFSIALPFIVLGLLVVFAGVALGDEPIRLAQVATFDNIPISSGGGGGAGLIAAGLLAGGLVVGLMVLLYMLVIFYATLCFIRLTVVLDAEEKPKMGPILKWGFKKLGSYIALMVRILIYVAWPMLAVLAGFIVAQFLPSDIVTILNYALGLAGLAAGVFMVIRSLRVVFSMYILADEECDSKTAMQKSIEVSMGNWWKIFFYGLGLAVFVGVVSFLSTFLVALIDESAAAIVNFVINILVGFLGYIFYFGFYRMLQAIKKS